MTCTVEDVDSWAYRDEQLIACRDELLPMFLATVTHADPSWLPRAQMLMNEYLQNGNSDLRRRHGDDGSTPDMRLRSMLIYEMHGESLIWSWPGSGDILNAYIDEHPGVTRDEHKLAMYNSVQYQQLRAWVSEHKMAAKFQGL